MKNDSITSQFDSLINDYLSRDRKYELQIRHFREFLSAKSLEDKVFNLYPNNIDEFFREAFKKKIGTESQVNSHIAALESFFDYLISKGYKFSELNGYINSSDFRTKMFQQVDETKNKTILSQKALCNILDSMDKYIQTNSSNQNQVYFEVLIARIFIKLSLILPLKVSQMLNVIIGDIHNSNIRKLSYNNIQIKIPNNLRKEIIFTIDYAEGKYSKIYTPKDKIFYFLYACINKKAEPAVINTTLPKVYKELKIDELLEKKLVGKKSKYIYPAESYKMTAIATMLENGVNIVYLAKLTGLDMGTLASVLDLNKKFDLCDNVSLDINKSIVSCDYYEYI